MKRKLKKSSNSSRAIKRKSKYLVFTRWHFTWFAIWVLVFISIFIVFFSSFFKVATITCQIKKDECSEIILAELDRLKGNSILTLNKKVIQTKIKASDPTIAELSVSIRLPKNLDVVIIKRRALAAIKSSQAEKLILLDSDGFLFISDEKKIQPLPIIKQDRISQIVLGEKIEDEQILKSLHLIKLLSDNYVSFDGVEIRENLLEVQLNQLTTAIFTGLRDMESQVSSLQQILSQATIDATPKTIDVRLDKPVLTYD